MTKRMLIDATHAEETRVVVLDGNRLEDFDVETSTKRQLKGNIYLAKVVRVEPSLQAAFVEYGGGRHGFLAFGEIHPDYYQIPVADRQRLLQLQAEEAREDEEDDEDDIAPEPPRAAAPADLTDTPFTPAMDSDEAPDPDDSPETDSRHAEFAAPVPVIPEPVASELVAAPPAEAERAADPVMADPVLAGDAEAAPDVAATPGSPEVVADEPAEPAAAATAIAPPEPPADAEPPAPPADPAPPPADAADAAHSEDDAARHGRAQPALMTRDERYGDDLARDDIEFSEPDLPPPETIGGESESSDSAEEARARRTYRFLRNYRIQEVIKRRQILLVQVVKEERGTKGAALTTYISLAGRFCVLMPNSPRGGGISRKITSAADRRRLKEITAELDIPHGMGLIVRTAGANRPKPEIRRDCEYLMRLWDDIREHTLRSIAPALIYEEASLIKRAIRDVYSRDVDEVIVDGDDGWKAAHDFMRMLMPSHARKVLRWRGNTQLTGGSTLPLFAKYGVEAQLDSMLSPTVQLRSGGYLVINQTEALVAIDVNSGRATRERGIEETALRTNLEAADEVARQLRLRDLAGLIVIDFIDMESKKHNAMVERRLKDALKTDRARIQVGHISHFGLMEMSRQRLRPSLAETSFIACPHCGGLGHVRSIESSAIHVLRAIEEEGGKARASLIMVHAAGAVVMYLLNHKRDQLVAIEAAYLMKVHFTADDTLQPPNIRIDRLRPALTEAERPPERLIPAPVAPAAPMPLADEEIEAEDVVEAESEADAAETADATGESEARGDDQGRRRRRRRRRGRREPGSQDAAATADSGGEDAEESAEESGEASEERLIVEPLPADAADDTPSREPLIVEALTDPDAERTAEEVTDPARAEQPSIDAAEFDENGLPRQGARRRGRRGGRRRRRGEDGEETSAPAEAGAAPEPAPVVAANPGPARVSAAGTVRAVPIYTGPTPADPFGGAFDIFDMMDMDAEPPPRPAAPAPIVAETPEIAPFVPEPVSQPALERTTEPASEPAPRPAPAPAEASEPPVAIDTPAPEPAAIAAPVADVVEPAPTAEPIAAPPPAPDPEPAPPVEHNAGPVAGPVAGPAIQPVLIGQGEPPAERKRGWWRR